MERENAVGQRSIISWNYLRNTGIALALFNICALGYFEYQFGNDLSYTAASADRSVEYYSRGKTVFVNELTSTYLNYSFYITAAFLAVVFFSENQNRKKKEKSNG